MTINQKIIGILSFSTLWRLKVSTLRTCSQSRKRGYYQWCVHAGSHSSSMLYPLNLRCWGSKHWRCLAIIRLPAKINKNMINHLWVGWGGTSLSWTCSFYPSSASLTTSSVSGGVTALFLDGPGVCPLPLVGILLRPLPRPLDSAPHRVTAPMVGSDAPCLAGVGVGTVNALVLTIWEIEWECQISICIT